MRPPRAPRTVAAIAVAGAFVAGAVYLAAERSDLLEESSAALSVAADLRLRQVAAWRAERLADAASIAAHPMVARAAWQAQAGPAPDAARADLLAWSTSRMKRDDYRGVAVLGAQGQPLVAVGTGPDEGEEEVVARARRRGAIALSDLHRDASGRLHVDLVVPLQRPGEEGRPAGAAVLRIDPAPFLAAIAAARPGDGAETLLVRPEGDQVVFLTAPRRRAGVGPLSLRLPAADPELVGAAAVRGREGTLRGKDCCGHDVLAAARPVPGTTWKLIVERETSDVLAPLGGLAVSLAVAMVSLTLAVGLATALWSRHQADAQRRSEEAREAERRRSADALQASEEELRRSEKWLRLVLEATGDAVWDLDVPAGRLRVSPRITALTGHAPEELASLEEAVRLLGAQEPPGLLERARAFLAGAESAVSREFHVITRAGEGRWLRVHGKVVERGAGGAALRAVGVVQDVTERRKLEASLALADRLASIGTLAAGVAHEVNNPLAYLIANIDFARDGLAGLAPQPARGTAGAGGGDGALVERLRTAVDEAADGAERVRRIVADLKTFSRADESLAPADVASVLEASIRVAHAEVKRRARLRQDLQPLPRVLANDSRLGQVFLNLLVNAAQAIPEGRPEEHEIRVSARAAGREVAVSVQDTGCGIPPESLGKIFDPFFTTKPAGTGTGLGLAICADIVRKLGGRIEVESAVGRGSTFTVLLPAWRPEPADGPPRAGGAAAPRAGDGPVNAR